MKLPRKKKKALKKARIKFANESILAYARIKRMGDGSPEAIEKFAKYIGKLPMKQKEQTFTWLISAP
jgi:hypothetical protein